MTLDEAKIEAFSIDEINSCKDTFYINRLEECKSITEVISIVTMIIMYTNMNKIRG